MQRERTVVTVLFAYLVGFTSVHDYMRGRWTDAIARAEVFIEAAEGSPHYMDSVCRWVRGALQLARGNVEAAVADARRGSGERALADELLAAWSGDGVGHVFESVDGGWVFGGLGRVEEFSAALDRARAQTPWLEASRRIAAGDAAAAADIYAEIGSVPDEAHARLRAGTEEQLRLALPVFTELGATAWEAEAESLLAASA